jgi:hypothetical protein
MALTCSDSDCIDEVEERDICFLMLRANAQDAGDMARGSAQPSMVLVTLRVRVQLRSRVRVDGAMNHGGVDVRVID